MSNEIRAGDPGLARTDGQGKHQVMLAGTPVPEMVFPRAVEIIVEVIHERVNTWAAGILRPTSKNPVH